MMEKNQIMQFFDRAAPQWDAEMIRNDAVIAKILDGAEVRQGADILDVACGTGVLIPDYLARNVASVTAVDISREMVRIAREKFPQDNVTILCADIESVRLTRKFDCVMVYNAFPHFPSPARLIETLCGLLKPGGTLTVAHGMSRREIDRHHTGAASGVSNGLMHEDALAALFEKSLRVTVKISDDTMYQVTGRL